MAPALSLESIKKRFGETEALKGVSFALERGEIHALLGENGAGKSTLMRVAYGLVAADAGRIRVDDVPASIPDPRAARRLGIGMVHQHFTSIPSFSVADNVALAAGWSPHRRPLLARVRQLMSETGLDLDPEAQVEDLSAGLKQRLEVLKALAGQARILLLDEPTSVLPPPEAVAFLDLLLRLRERGIAAVLITHKLEEALRIADRVTILRRGELVRTGPKAAETRESLAIAMLGAAPRRTIRPTRRPGVDVLVRAAGLEVSRVGGAGSGLRAGSIEVRSGEIVGIAAVEGNGQRELLRALAGLLPARAGSIAVAGPVALIPEDRTSEALIGKFTLTENIVLRLGSAAPGVRRGWVKWAAARQRTAELLIHHAIHASGPDAEARTLSGGNQQRLVIASVEERRPRVILAENPARGLDLRATGEVYDQLRAAAERGAAVVVHLPDLDDLIEVADRIVVVARGETIPVPWGANREFIGQQMLGTPISPAATGGAR